MDFEVNALLAEKITGYERNFQWSLQLKCQFSNQMKGKEVFGNFKSEQVKNNE